MLRILKAFINYYFVIFFMLSALRKFITLVSCKVWQKLVEYFKRTDKRYRDKLVEDFTFKSSVFFFSFFFHFISYHVSNLHAFTLLTSQKNISEAVIVYLSI